MKKIISIIAILFVVFSSVTPALAADPGTPEWTDLGPGQIRANAVNSFVNVEGMTSTNNPTTGAITKVLVDPGNSNNIYVGAVNGGIWKTTDGGKYWTPLTDRLSSLSIGAMNFNSSDATNQTIIAGTGKQSAFGFASGPLTGIQYSTNGGTNWTELGRSALFGKDITGVAARGSGVTGIMMAAVRNISTPITEVGLYRSTDGGASFSNSAAVAGLPIGNIQSLAADPTDSTRFYLSVVNGNNATTGIYRSDNTGATWTPVAVVSDLSTSNSNGRILLSVGASGVLVAQIQQGKPADANYILEIQRSADQGATWTNMGRPSTPYPGFTGLFPSGQTRVHGAVLADPTDPYVVYAAGDTQYSATDNLPPPNSIGASQWTCPIFRGVYNPVTQLTTWTYITNNNTLSGSAPHADARTFAVDANGRLLFGGDGGLNAYPSPATIKTSDWIPIMDNLRVTEMTQSCWNSITHTVSAAAQDVGAYYQFPGQKGTYDWSSTRGGDGGPGPVNVETFKSTNISVVYASGQYLGSFKRFKVGATDDAQKSALTMTSLQPYWQNGLTRVWLAGNETYMSFLSLVALNRADPRKMAIGGVGLFIGTDNPSQDIVSSTLWWEFPVTSMGALPASTEITSLAYGTNSVGSNVNANALLAGTSGAGYLYYSTDPSSVPMTLLTNYLGKYVYKAIFDERDGNKFFVADGIDVWRSASYTGALTPFESISGTGANKLPANFVDRQALAFAANNGVNALFVGGVSNTANGSGVYVTRFTSSTSADPVDPTSTTWSSFGGITSALANAPVYGMSYDTTDDVLLVNLFGRGAWVVYDLTSYFSEATTLMFGKANNASTPAASLLTDGTLVDGVTTFSRGLTKYGTGKLTVSGAGTYTGVTTLNAGTINLGVVETVGISGPLGKSVAANPGSIVLNGGYLQYSAANNNDYSGRFSTAASQQYNVDTNSINVSWGTALTSSGGSLTKIGSGILTLTVANTYTGATTVSAGTLALRNNLALQNSALDTSGAGVVDVAGFTAPTFGGLKGSKDLASVITTGYDSVTSLTLNPGTGATNTYSGVIANGAAGMTLTKSGLGTQVLSGANIYTGTTTITAGTLKAGDRSALGTGAVNVINNATLDIGTTKLNIGSGNYTQAAGATLRAAVNGTSSGTLATTGSCTLAAGDSLVLSVTNFIPNNTSYTIIDGAVGGSIATPVITTPGYDNALFTVTTVGEDLKLVASRGAANGFAADAGNNPNAAAAGAVLDNIETPTGDMQTVLNALDGLSDSEVDSSLDTMLPEVNSGVVDTSTTSLDNFIGVAIDRVEDVLTDAGTAGAVNTGVSAGDENKLNGIWGKGYGSYLAQGTRNDIAGYDAWNAGTALGIDRLFCDLIALGISGGWAYGHVNSDATNNAKTNINSAQTTIYGGYSDQNLPYFIDAAISFAYNWYNGTRDVSVGPAINSTAKGKYGGQQYGAYLGGGYKINLIKNLEFTPLISLQWSYLRLNSYSETGAGALNLDVASQAYDQLQSGLGASIAAPKKRKWGTFTPEVHGKWFYDFLGSPMAVTSNFNGGGGDFGSNGCKPALNSFNVGGQLIFEFNNDVSLIANCDTEMADRFFGVYGSLTLRHDF